MITDKPSRLIDATLINDEIEMLYVRLNILRSFNIRTFRICESPVTHQGKIKPIYVTDLLDKLKLDFPDCDIETIVINIPANLNPRESENYVRNTFLSDIYNEFPSDAVFFSDIDELPDKSQIEEFLKNPSQIYSVHMDLKYLFCNMQHKGVPVFKYAKIGPTSELARVADVRWMSYPKIGFVNGMHLSFCGFDEDIYINKLASYGQPEFNVPLLNSPGYFNRVQMLGIDPLARYNIKGKGVLKLKTNLTSSLELMIFSLKPRWFCLEPEYDFLTRLVCSAAITREFLFANYDVDGVFLLDHVIKRNTIEKLILLIRLSILIRLSRAQFFYRSKIKTLLFALYAGTK